MSEIKNIDRILEGLYERVETVKVKKMIESLKRKKEILLNDKTVVK